MIHRRFVVLASLALVVASCASSDGDEAATTAPATEAPVETETPAETAAPATEAPVETEAPAETETPVDTAPTPDTLPETETPEEPAPYDFSAIDPIVADVVDELGLYGAGMVIVDADAGVVHEDYWGEFSADRI